MHSFRSLRSSVAALAATLALAGCSGGVGSTSSPAGGSDPAGTDQAAADPARPGGAERPADGRVHGPIAALKQAVGGLTLSAEQKPKVDAAIAALVDEGPGASPAGDAFDAALVAQVRAGQVDESALAKELDGIQAEVRERTARMAKALNDLHAALEPAQRESLVASLQTQLAEGRARHGRWGKGGDRDHARGGDRAERRGPRADGPRKAGPFAELNLTPEQHEKLRAAREADHAQAGDGAREQRREKMKAMRERGARMMEAFKGASFDAATLLDGEEMAKGAREHAARQVKHAATLASVLTAEQRAKVTTLRPAWGAHRVGPHAGKPEMAPPPPADDDFTPGDDLE